VAETRTTLTGAGGVPELPPGTRLGPYTIREWLGEGGFATVYLADQTEPIQRRVAVKVIKPGMDSRQVIARFEAERQALALIDHPNVAKVFDAGTTDRSRPYFVMEYIAGEPITTYCDRHRATTRQRLELLQQACAGMQHAHWKGIVHRDLKPSNILVTGRDEGPLVKIIDFGVAKALHQPLTRRTVFTGFGQLIGTLEYMSPEQAEMTGLDIDSRTDVYSLGVVLYELLTGSLPFDPARLRSAAIGEIQRIIREEDPPNPSTRLSSLGASTAEVAMRHRVPPTALEREVRGDLDWITMRALAKDREARYDTPSDLADDIGRHLVNLPVEAGPPSVSYHLRKFIRRHRPAVATVAGGAVLLLAGTAATAWQAVRATRAEHDARTAQRQADLQRELASRRADEAVRLAYQASVAAAAAAAQGGDPGTARLHLDRAPASLRGWEWRYLHRGLDESRAVLAGHTDAVLSVSAAPDGALLASGSLDGTVKLWRVTSASELASLTGHAGPVPSVAFSPDATRLASASYDGSVRLWDLDRRAATVLGRSDGKMLCVAFAGQGDRVAAGDDEGRVHLWDVAAGGAPRAFDGGSAQTMCLAFDPAGERLATGGEDGAVRVWDLAGGRLAGFAAHAESITSIAWAPDGSRLATCSIDKVIRLWNPTSGERLAECSGHEAPVFAVAFAPAGDWLVSGSHDRTVRLWDTSTGRAVTVCRGHTETVYSVAVSRDGAWLASASKDGTVRLWDADRHGPASRLSGHDGGVRWAGFTSGTAERVLSVDDGTLRAWDVATGTVVAAVVVGSVAAATGTADGLVAVGAPDGTLSLWRGGDPTRLRVLDGHTGTIRSLAFSRDGAILASASRDQTIRLWSVGSGEELKLLPTRQRDVIAMSFLPDGVGLATSSLDGAARLWDTAAAEVTLDWTWSGPMTALAVSPEGQWIAVGGYDGSLALWETSSGSHVRDLAGHVGAVTCLAFTHDGSRIASGSDDGSLRLWDPVSGDHLLTITAHTEAVLHLVFRKRDDLLVSASVDSTVGLWWAE